MQIIKEFIKKINIKNNFLILILLINITFSLSGLEKRNIKNEDEKKLSENQGKAYPNTFEPITSKEDLRGNKFKLPKLSDSFSEHNQSKTIKRELFFDRIKYTQYKLTRGELEQIFMFIDREKKDEISFIQWESFRTLFILPFEACDEENNYLLTEKEFGICFKSDPKYQQFSFRRRHKKDLFKKIIETISHDGKSSMNFGNYLFFRKAIYAWRSCQSSPKYISVSSLGCALNQITRTYRRILKVRINRIALKYQFQDNALIAPDFICYLNIANMFNYFNILSYPNKNLILEKSNFIKAIHEDRIPMNFEVSDVNYFYEITGLNNDNGIYRGGFNTISGMNFENFCFFFHYNKLFNRYSIKKPNLLAESELLKMLDDRSFPKPIINAIDYSFSNLSETNHLEGSLIHQRKRLNESKFFNKLLFMQKNERNKQDHSAYANSINKKSTIYAGYYDNPRKNVKNRKVYFTIFRNYPESSWTKNNYYKALIISNLFASLRTENYYYRIPVARILRKYNTLYQSVNPPLNNRNTKNYKIYEFLPTEIRLDALTFLSIENFFNKFNSMKNSASMRINEQELKIIMKDFGIANIPDTVIDLDHSGYDSISRRQFRLIEVARKIFINQATSSELRSDRRFIKKNKLKFNYDLSRRFPEKPRRHRSSPFV